MRNAALWASIVSPCPFSSFSMPVRYSSTKVENVWVSRKEDRNGRWVCR